MRRYLLFLLLLLTFNYSYSQDSQLKFDHFNQKTGLPDQQIQFITQDDQGYIWIGTLLGLVKYDGYQLKTYPLYGKKTDEFVRTWIEDADHNIWCATYSSFGNTGGALFRYNRQTDNFSRFPYPSTVSGEVALQFADKYGNLWGYGRSENLSSQDLPTRKHIVRFDTRAKNYTYLEPTEQPGTAEGRYLTLHKGNDPDQKIWMGDGAGLHLYNYTDKAFHPFLATGDTTREKSISRIFEAPSEPGILWMAVFDRALHRHVIERLDTRTKTIKYYSHFDTPGLTPGNDSLYTVYEDSHKRLWFGTANGLLLYDRQSQKFTPFTPADTLANNPQKNLIQNIAEAKDGRLWLLAGFTLLTFDPGTHQFRRHLPDYKDPQGLHLSSLYDILFDRNGTMWLGDLGEGVGKLNMVSSAFSVYPYQVQDGTYFQIGFTNNIATTAGGYSWYTNDQGIFKWQPGNGKPVQVYKASAADRVIGALFTAKDGKIYFSNKHGLQVIDPATGKHESYATDRNDPTTIGSNSMNRILQDHTGTVWAGTTASGISAFDPATKKFTRYPFISHANSEKSNGKLDSYIVDCIYEDSHNNLWVGTHIGGLNRFDRKTGKFTSYYVDGKVNVYTVTHLLDDHAGHLWVGTYSLGLFEFDPKTGQYIRHINEASGLLYNSVTGLEQDENGNLWVSSVRGLTRIDPKTLAIKTFPIDDVLPGKSLISDYNLAKAGDKMLLVLTDGIAVFNPHKLAGNPYPPVIHIENAIFNDALASYQTDKNIIAFGNKKLEVAYNQNRVIFTYVALHYENPAENIYKYKLDGYDKQWVPAGHNRWAAYTNLAPGTYTFHVIAANSSGVWNSTGDSLVIVINPPWWRTWWAWVLWVVLFVLAVYAFVAYRSRKLMQDKKILEHKVHIRTEEVLQQKEEIEAQRDNLEQAYDELKTTQAQLVQREKMASLGELTAGIAHEIQNPLNFVNNFSDVNREMLEELKAESAKPKAERDAQLEAGLISDLIENETKINHHGKRADAIVKGMLQHSRTSTGQKEPTDLNALADEYLRLAYHGLRAKDKSFNAELVTNFDPKLPKVNIMAQDIGRVILNIINNAFYATQQRAKTVGPDYRPAVEVRTSMKNDQVEISIKDNGSGIPENIREKIMQPFFTTKPTGEGTGLGLSLSYDIIVKAHSGKIEVTSKEGEFAQFMISIPV